MKVIEISDMAFEFLKMEAVPLEDTTISVVDRLIGKCKAYVKPLPSLSGELEAKLDMSFGLANLPNVSFTTIDEATINGAPVNKLYWNDILAETIAVAAKDGSTIDKIKNLLSAKVYEGAPADNGSWHVAGTTLSFQGMDAVRACRNIVALSKTFKIDVSIHLRWQLNPKAQYAGKVGHLVLP